MAKIESICVYCGSSDGRRTVYRDAGLALGRCIAEAGLRLVYGAGTKGVMGAVARGAMDAGGSVTGIIPRFLIREEATERELRRLDTLIVTEDMHARKHAMYERADAFVALPGGIGTLEEIVEIITWAQLARHEKPVVFANVERFWQPVLRLLEHMEAEGFVHSAQRVRPLVVDRAEDVVAAVLAAGATARGESAGERAAIDRL